MNSIKEAKINNGGQYLSSVLNKCLKNVYLLNLDICKHIYLVERECKRPVVVVIKWKRVLSVSVSRKTLIRVNVICYPAMKS